MEKCPPSLDQGLQSMDEQLDPRIDDPPAVVVPPTLEKRLQSMDEVDGRIDDLLAVVAEVMASLDKDKPLSKAKMDELYKKYELRLDEIQQGIAEQLTYMEQVCVGAEHQGSTFHYHQVVELSATRLQSLRAHLAALRRDTTNKSSGKERVEGEEEDVSATTEDGQQQQQKQCIKKEGRDNGETNSG